MIKNFKLTLTLLLFILIGFNACQTSSKVVEEKRPLRIAVSKLNDTDWYKDYTTWLKRNDSTVQLVDLYYIPEDSAFKVFKECDGLLLTGGPDIYPEWYGRIQDTVKCDGYDHRRDSLEFKLINDAFMMKMPVFGICRGQQLSNVALGGTLVADIPTMWPDTSVYHRKLKEFKDMHEAYVEKNTPFHSVVKVDSAIVNSYHHQGIGTLSPELEAAAHTSDGLVEAIQWKDTTGKSHLFAVQWHPERLEKGNPLSDPLAKDFLKYAAKYQQKK